MVVTLGKDKTTRPGNLASKILDLMEELDQDSDFEVSIGDKGAKLFFGYAQQGMVDGTPKDIDPERIGIGYVLSDGTRGVVGSYSTDPSKGLVLRKGCPFSEDLIARTMERHYTTMSRYI